MQVTVITFTEHDLDLVGRVFLNEDKMKEAIAPLVAPIDYTVDEYLDEGLVDWSVVPVEGFGDTVVPFTFTIEGPNFEDIEPRGSVKLTRDDGDKPKCLFSVHEGEPEDMNLARNLCDCMSVETLIELGHSLALEGKAIDVTVEEPEYD